MAPWREMCISSTPVMETLLKNQALGADESFMRIRQALDLRGVWKWVTEGSVFVAHRCLWKMMLQRLEERD